MIKATVLNKKNVVDILTDSFSDNLSVQYILKDGANKAKKIRALMEYSFDMCMLFGEVFLSDDNKACALVMFPYLKKDNLKSLFLDVRLIIHCTGIGNIKKVLHREKLIKEKHPTKKIYYLWFIGVERSQQNKAIGSALLRQLLKRAELKNLPVFLETSTQINIPWYEKFAFKEYASIDLGYTLHFLSNN